MMPRATTLLALAQVLVVILGVVAVGVVMKASGYPQNDQRLTWNPLALFLRDYGLLFIIAIGVTFADLATIIFIFAATHTHTRPLFLHL